MHYTSPRHERLFRNIVRGKDYPSHTLAALYLLTAKRKLWKKWSRAVTNQGIDLGNCRRNIDTGDDGYQLERVARSLASCSAMQVPLRDLANSTSYPDSTLRLIITALWIARADPQIINEIIQERKEHVRTHSQTRRPKPVAGTANAHRSHHRRAA